MFPDIGNVTFLLDPRVFLAVRHRGITPSLVMVPVWVLLIAWAVARLLNGGFARGRERL